MAEINTTQFEDTVDLINRTFEKELKNLDNMTMKKS
jgi:hypothetical protein